LFSEIVKKNRSKKWEKSVISGENKTFPAHLEKRIKQVIATKNAVFRVVYFPLILNVFVYDDQKIFTPPFIPPLKRGGYDKLP
jgi:hypothetical protein